MSNLNGIAVQRIVTSLGATIDGVDLREPLAASSLATLKQALLDHGVIFCRGQNLTAEQYWSFMENFGIPMREESTGTEENTAADLQIGDMSKARFGTAVWHSDTTCLAKPPLVTALRAVEVPPFGGDTCWSSMSAAWDALSPHMQRMLDGLTAVHVVDFTIERMRDLGDDFGRRYSERNDRSQVHPVVLLHPETGRKALYVNESFTKKIVELNRLESRAVLDFLFRHVESPDFTMRWKWTEGDLAIWDNRAVQHYAVPDYTATRRMQRVVLAGVKPGEPSTLQPRWEKPKVGAA